MPYTASREELEMTANDLVKMVGSGKIKINIEQRFGLDEVVKAHESMEARKTTGCSILLP
jgi:NADPH2:quinone reductase